MRIVVLGAGLIGVLTAYYLARDGHEVVVLSRTPGQQPWKVVAWDARTLGAWVSEIEQAEVVINLAGRSVNCRYSASNRAAIMASRHAPSVP